MPSQKYFSHNAPVPFALFWNADQTAYPGGPGFDPPGTLNIRRVDKSLRKLVKAINESQTGITTVSACEGHPERDEYGVVHVELWLRVDGANALKTFFEWIERAVQHRINSAGYSKERVIRVEFLGATRFGCYFVVYADFLNLTENRRVINSLTKTWGK